jgi:PAS domain S-box-containing protein
MGDVPRTLTADDAARAFGRLFESARVGLALVDRSGRLFAVNPAVCRLLGRDAEAVVGQAVVDVVHPDRLAEVAADLARLLSGIDDEQERDRTVVRRDGSEIAVTVKGLLVRDPRGEPAFAVVVVDPERLSRDRVRSVAHDLNNLLTAVRGYGELLVRHADDPDRVRDSAVVVQSVVDRSVDLVRDLLADATRPRVQRLDVNEVVLGMHDVASQLVGTGHEIHFRLDPSSPHIEADRASFERALANLATNARDAMPEGGTLTFESRAHEEWVDVVVSDTGVGIEEEVLARIFERDFSTKGPDLGYGIGLANVREFVQAAGGRIDVVSEPGAGATFTLTLPRAS